MRMKHRCAFCGEVLPARLRADAAYCSKRCRQTAFRLRRRLDLEGAGRGAMRIAYADPPYPGLAARYYSGEPSFAGEVDHGKLLEALAGFDGWALSTSARTLREVLPLCPVEARVCAWVKPIGASPQSLGLHNCWEPVIVMPARRLQPGTRDFLSAKPARHGGELIGRKPIAFAAWLFEALGMLPGDELTDLFPGTGIITQAWTYLSREALSDNYSDQRELFPAVGGEHESTTANDA